MKIFLLTILFFTRIIVFGQNTAEIDSALAFIKKTGIDLNSVEPPKGFSVYYNCDSMLFMRGEFGDTIKIWTPGTEMPQELDMFKKTITYETFGKTQLAREVQSDGRILIISYWQTQFIFRNDSLFQIENSNELPEEVYTKVFTELLNENVDEELISKKLDSISAISEAQAVYIPKLIFAKSMFSNNQKKVKLSKQFNYKEDTIVLEKEWKEKEKRCYLIRINNNEDGQDTTYAYAINEEMKFIWWQGCDAQQR
ncbi:MAG: hypothetical protein EOP48_13105 [Sphingobacteriales bacterium]|nr:MAG: hypothetical protein EOP48_13105 [Sphingobacteriales bacterium]